MRLSLLDIPIDAFRRDEAASRLVGMFETEGGKVVSTPNPEMLVAAARDPLFKAVLQKADLAIPDGIGLIIVSRLLGTPLPQRISGTDFIEDICAIAAEKGKSVYLLGGTNDVAHRAGEVLLSRHPGLRIAGTSNGGQVMTDAEGVPRIAPEELAKINAAEPDALLVAFGHGKQEKWIAAHLPQLPSVRIAMGVGGAFDFIAGDVRRSPRLLQKLGLEWFWRLTIQPWRIQRIWTAVAVFPFLVLTRKRDYVNKT